MDRFKEKNKIFKLIRNFFHDFIETLLTPLIRPLLYGHGDFGENHKQKEQSG